MAMVQKRAHRLLEADIFQGKMHSESLYMGKGKQGLKQCWGWRGGDCQVMASGASYLQVPCLGRLQQHRRHRATTSLVVAALSACGIPWT